MNVTTCSEASIDVQAGRGKARISSICSFDRTYTAVVGTNKGQIKIYQLERMPSTLPERLPDTRARDHLRDSVVGQKNNMDSL